MGTKNDPGQYNCYASAEPDEPIFTFKGSDQLASYMVSIWASLKVNDFKTALRTLIYASECEINFRTKDDPKMVEANACAKAMYDYSLNKRISTVEESVR